jgi:hypothetical protein
MTDLAKTGQDAPIVLPASQRLWSEEVGIAAADDLLPINDPGYEFSNGRKYETPA